MAEHMGFTVRAKENFDFGLDDRSETSYFRALRDGRVESLILTELEGGG